MSMDVDGTVSSFPDQLAPTLLEFFDTGMELTNECRSYGVRATFFDDTILITLEPAWTFQDCGLADMVFTLVMTDHAQRPLAFELDAEQHTITFAVDGGTVTFERCSGDGCPDVDAF